MGAKTEKEWFSQFSCGCLHRGRGDSDGHRDRVAAAEDARAEVAGGDIVEDAGQEAIPQRDYWKIAILQKQSDLLVLAPKMWIGKYAIFDV